jgi:hypothetical protein
MLRTNAQRLSEASIAGFLVSTRGKRDDALRNAYWRICTDQRRPYIEAWRRRGRWFCRYDADPSYNTWGCSNVELNEVDSERVWNLLCDARLPIRNAEVSGGRPVTYMFAGPLDFDKLMAALPEIAVIARKAAVQHQDHCRQSYDAFKVEHSDGAAK